MEDEKQEQEPQAEQPQEIVTAPYVKITFGGNGNYELESNTAYPLQVGMILDCAAAIKKGL